MRWGFLLVLFPVAAIAGGGQGVYTALQNPKPLAMTCAEYLARPHSQTWLQLSDCVPDWEKGGYTGGDAADELFVPLRAPGGGTTRLVLRTKDKDVLARINRGEFSDAPGRYEGLVQFGMELRDKERKTVADVVEGVTDDFVLLEHDKRPEVGLHGAMLGGGLLVLGFAVWRFLKKRRASAAPPTAEPFR